MELLLRTPQGYYMFYHLYDDYENDDDDDDCIITFITL